MTEPGSGDGAPPARSRPGHRRTNPFDPPDQDSPITYDYGLVSHPIALSYSPTIDADQAVARALAIGYNSSLQPGAPTAALRLVSVGYEGQDASYTPHPAWVVIWHGSRAYGSGPKRPSPPTGRPAAPLECLYLVIVDASTGQVQDVRQLCR